MTVMPLILIIQLVFAGVIFPLGPRGNNLSRITLSRWGCYAICTQADYNNLPCDTAWNQLQALPNYVGEILEDEYLQEELEKYIPEVKDPVREFASSQLRKSQYTSDKEHVFKYWGILLGFSVLYLLIGTIALELIDRDKR